MIELSLLKMVVLIFDSLMTISKLVRNNIKKVHQPVENPSTWDILDSDCAYCVTKSKANQVVDSFMHY